MTLGRDFFDRPVLEVARDLLGASVSHAGVTVRLSEVEAYAGIGDPGSHGFRGMTPRTRVLFGAPGSLYVYFTYGMHWCANLVTGPPGHGAAVLLRAGLVVGGLDLAKARRERPGRAAIPVRDLARGPARLTVALGLDGAHNGMATTSPGSALRVQMARSAAAAGVSTGPRVGVSGPGGDGTAYPWRLWLDGDPTVSPYRAAPQRRGRRTTPPDSRRDET